MHGPGWLCAWTRTRRDDQFNRLSASDRGSMDEQHGRHVKALFAQAADLPEDERGAFLDAACRGEPDLRAEVTRLLAYDAKFEVDENEQTFLKSPLVARRSERRPNPRFRRERRT